ncbi:mitochondrial Homoaconitase [Puccinia graminis f. sp. tritici]|uniref:Mitochondrial Homoaconitase n=1 Tax=Puccinia graminis f. sp. tritici TaxID=56615 RepID=A0A5B0SKP0_PUCGR|nr:mitochondrial Homoaconitase [Puccinia graminis f. sp. tritici]
MFRLTSTKLRTRIPLLQQQQQQLRRNQSTSSNQQTLIEKIVQKYAYQQPANKRIRSGDFIVLKPEHVMTHDNTSPVINKFKSIGASKIDNPRQPVFTIDHDVQNKSPENLKKYSRIEAFAHLQDVDFFPPGRGIGVSLPFTSTPSSSSSSSSQLENSNLTFNFPS